MADNEYRELDLTNEQRISLEKLPIERERVLKKKNDLKEEDEHEPTKIIKGQSSSSGVKFETFSLSELKEATNNFNNSHKIGEGGYGSVYKAFLNDTIMAVKILNKDGGQGEAEFNQEVKILSQVRHPNLVALIGACLEAQALVYEFLPNGSLDAYLTGGKNFQLSWKYRIRIAFEICSALIFLHSELPHGIAHGDLKPENILLDSNFTSKLSDFGISRNLQLTKFTKTPIHATLRPSFTGAYVDPEYFSYGELTTKSDTFSFGIILMQLLTGTKPQGIMDRVEEALDNKKLDTIVDGSAGEWPIKAAKKLALLGLRCSAQSRKKRPDLAKDVLPVIKSMKDVAESTSCWELWKKKNCRFF